MPCRCTCSTCSWPPWRGVANNLFIPVFIGLFDCLSILSSFVMKLSAPIPALLTPQVKRYKTMFNISKRLIGRHVRSLKCCFGYLRRLHIASFSLKHIGVQIRQPVYQQFAVPFPVAFGSLRNQEPWALYWHFSFYPGSLMTLSMLQNGPRNVMRLRAVALKLRDATL